MKKLRPQLEKQSEDQEERHQTWEGPESRCFPSPRQNKLLLPKETGIGSHGPPYFQEVTQT